MVKPGDHAVEDDRGSIHDCEFVVSGGEAPPLFEPAVAAFDHVPTPILLGVELGRAASARAASSAMALLVARLRDDGRDTASTQVSSVGPRGVCLVTERSLGSCPAADAELFQQRNEHRRVTVLSRRADRHQRQAMTIDELMRFRRQTAARAADHVVRRLDQ